MWNKKTLILIGFVLLKFLIQYNLVSPEYNLQRDDSPDPGVNIHLFVNHIQDLLMNIAAKI